MNSIVCEFGIFNCLPQHIISEIEIFFVTFYNGFKIAFCVTNKNKVFALGENINKLLGYQKFNKNYIKINELCNQNIEEFFDCSEDFMFARSSDKYIYGWGNNNSGQLGTGHVSQRNLFDTPTRLDYLNGKNIVQISSGRGHSLALTSDCFIYGWGDTEGQLGYTANSIEFLPFQINLWTKIRFIHCYKNCSFVVTEEGRVYKSAINGWHLILNSINPTLKVTKVIKNDFSTYFLDTDGNINFLTTDKTMDKINLENNTVIDLRRDFSNIIIMATDILLTDNVWVIKEWEAIKSNHTNFFEYYSIESFITNKTILIKDQMIYEIRFNFERGISCDSWLNDIHNINNWRTYLKRDRLFCSKLFINYRGAKFYKDNKKIFVNLEGYEKYQKIKQSNVKNTRTFRDLSTNLQDDVKCYYESGAYGSSEYFALFIVNDGNVYGFGNNLYGKLGFGDQDKVLDCAIIDELCKKNIEEFYEGHNSMFARNDKNKIFGWGQNKFGQLCQNYRIDEYLKPLELTDFDGKDIVEIKCGTRHCLALSSKGDVYGWGDNRKWQIHSNGNNEFVLEPVKIDFKSHGETKIIKINCREDCSFAVSEDGFAFCWGDIYFEGNPDSIIKLNIAGVTNIYRYLSGYCFLLKKDGFIYKYSIFDDRDERERQIHLRGKKFRNMFKADDPQRNICNDIIFQSGENIFEFEGNQISETDYMNFYEFYLKKYNSSYKTIHITKDGYRMTKEIIYNNIQKLLVIQNGNVFENKYETKFLEIKEIGRGGFGRVLHVKHRKKNKEYAIKKAEVHIDHPYSVLKEIKMLSDALKSEFIVKYISAWIENKTYTGNRRVESFAYIQMELCLFNLNELISTMNEKFFSDQRFLIFDYFIACELFRELTECVEYLHSLNNKIIHRDIKPENVLVSDGLGGRYLKLCDFGLSRLYDPQTILSRNVGTQYRVAPEVKYTNDYDTKSDVYSLALTATEIFHFEDCVEKIGTNAINDLSIYSQNYNNPKIRDNFKYLFQTLKECIFIIEYKKRLDCESIKDRIDTTIKIKDIDIILNDTNLSDFKNILLENDPILKIIKGFYECKIAIFQSTAIS